MATVVIIVAVVVWTLWRSAVVKRALRDVGRHAKIMGKGLMLLPPLLFAGSAVMFYVGMQHGSDDLPSVFIGHQAPGLAAAKACRGYQA